MIYNHDPLSAYAVVQKTLIDGKVYFDRARDIAERPEHEKEKKALIEKERKANEKKSDQKKLEDKKSEDKKSENPPKTPQGNVESFSLINDSHVSGRFNGGAL